VASEDFITSRVKVKDIRVAKSKNLLQRAIRALGTVQVVEIWESLADAFVRREQLVQDGWVDRCYLRS
jgi:hypothetical protein